MAIHKLLPLLAIGAGVGVLFLANRNAQEAARRREQAVETERVLEAPTDRADYWQTDRQLEEGNYMEDLSQDMYFDDTYYPDPALSMSANLISID